MSDDNRIPEEAEFITAAYAEKVKEAFLGFAENLSVGQAEKSCKERFLRSLAMIRKARDLALDAISEDEDLQAQANEARPAEEPAGEALSEEDRAMIEHALSGTTGVAAPRRLR